MPSIAISGGGVGGGGRFLFPGLYFRPSIPLYLPSPDVSTARERRFRASYVGCCELKARYSVSDLNDAVEQLCQVRFVVV